MPRRGSGWPKRLESCAFEAEEKQKMKRTIIANCKLQIKDCGQWTVGSG
jgi:hypothetical protein